MAQFELTPEGIQQVSAGGVVVPLTRPDEAIAEVPGTAPAPAILLPPAIQSGVDLVDQAKNRVRELKLKLKQARQWQRELDELQRLVAAARPRRKGK